MLARAAGCLYWMGRYLERAENVTRLLLVASDLSIEFEGVDEGLAQREWDDLVAAVPASGVAHMQFSPEEGLATPYVRAFLLDDANPVSVQHSLGRARENARSVREALTREVFLELNEAFRGLERAGRRRIRSPVQGVQMAGGAHQAILTILGAIEHTLSRDEGWTFLKLGEAMERTQRTLLVLRAKLPALGREEGKADLPLFYARWRGLLRCVASLENFRRVHGAGLEPDRVRRFLLFDAAAPRSVLCGVSRIDRYLASLVGPDGSHAARRLTGRLLAKLRYDEDEILAKASLDEFCGHASKTLHDIHTALERQYFPS